MNCKFCKSIKTQDNIFVIWEDEKHLLFLDNQTGPLKQEISSIENQIASIHKDQESRGNQEVATDNEIEEFAKRSVSVLKILGFEKKREMILNVVDKVIATQSKLLVYGKIPIKNYEYKTISRNRRVTKCWKIDII